MRRIGWGAAWVVTLLVGGVLLGGWLGWLEGGAAFELAMGVLALAGLWFVVWLPWDLYFAAKNLAVDQDDSAARGIEISDRDRGAARHLAPRLLALCVGLHIGGAGAVALATWASGGRIGYAFAGFYLATLALRPIGALYRHLGRRLEELSQRARYPREDVVSLIARVQVLEDGLERLDRLELPADRERQAELLDELRALDRTTGARIAGFDDKIDRVLAQMERSMAQLTEDRELLTGIRAFVRVVKQA